MDFDTTQQTIIAELGRHAGTVAAPGSGWPCRCGERFQGQSELRRHIGTRIALALQEKERDQVG